MSLETRVMQDMKEAMKAKDQATLRTVRAIKAAILLLKTDGSGKEIDAEAEIKIVQKLLKQRQDSFDIYTKQNREDLAITEKEEIDVLMRYLPKQLTSDELKEDIQSIIQQTGATSMKEMGKVIGMANQKLAGKTEGKAIADMVKSLLS